MYMYNRKLTKQLCTILVLVLDTLYQDHAPFLYCSSDFDVEAGSEAERLIPGKLVRYPTQVRYLITHQTYSLTNITLLQKYNNKFMRYTMNIFGFSEQRVDFNKFDISACYEDGQKLHIMVTNISHKVF